MRERRPRIAADDVPRALGRDGWSERKSKSGHRVLRHPTKPGRPVVPYHRGRTLTPKTLANILHEAGLTVDQLRDLLSVGAAEVI